MSSIKSFEDTTRSSVIQDETIVISDESDEEIVSKRPKKRATRKAATTRKDVKRNASSAKTPIRPIPPKSGQSSIKNYFKNKSSLSLPKESVMHGSNTMVSKNTLNSNLTPKPSHNQSQPMTKKTRQAKAVPVYKVVEDTTFAVDAFQFGDIPGVTQYFLTHFHSDHYVGLKKSFCYPLHVSSITARLVAEFIGVDRKWIKEHEMNVPFYVDEVEVVALDANHCPGAVMFLFRFQSGRCILHTGDFRACSDMEMVPFFWNYRVDTVYLDTTYLATRGQFVSQMSCIDDAKHAVRTFLRFSCEAKPLIVIGTYVIGKEKVWASIADAFDLKVWLEPQRRKAAECIFSPDDPIRTRIVDTKAEATIHVLPLGQTSYPSLQEYLNEQTADRRLLAIRPSGWEKPSKVKLKEGARISVIGVQYSEHSSYEEMKRFIRFLMPSKVIPTVPVSGKSLSITKQVPKDWMSIDIKPQRYNFQRNILSFMSKPIHT